MGGGLVSLGEEVAREDRRERCIWMGFIDDVRSKVIGSKGCRITVCAAAEDECGLLLRASRHRREG